MIKLSKNSEESRNGLAAVVIDNYSQNDKITITGNKIYDFKNQDSSYYYSAAINIANLYTTDSSDENFVYISNNTIENSKIGVLFRNYNSENISTAELEAVKEYYKNGNIFTQIEPENEVRFDYGLDR